MSTKSPLLNKAAVNLPNIEQFLNDGNIKRQVSKSAYYNVNHAMELLPVLVDIVKTAQPKAFPLEQFQISPRSLIIKISQGWQFLCDLGEHYPQLKEAIERSGIDFNAIRELRGSHEILRTDKAIIIRKRIERLNDKSTTINSENQLHWKQQLMDWINKDESPKQGLLIEGIVLSQKDIDYLNRVLGGFVDELDYSVAINKIEVKEKVTT